MTYFILYKALLDISLNLNILFFKIFFFKTWTTGFPRGSVGKESACNARYYLQCRRLGFDIWVGKIPWRRKW